MAQLLAAQSKGEEIGLGRWARRAYGFDEIALVPGTQTMDPLDVDLSFNLGSVRLSIPFIASAMDGVVDVAFAVAMTCLGGMAVLNLDGVQTRFDDPRPIIREIVDSPAGQLHAVFNKVYAEPVKDHLIRARIESIKQAGGIAAVSSVPALAQRRAQLAASAGADVFVVQGTVLTARHRSSHGPALDLVRLCEESPIPVLAGNCVSYGAALDLMRCGVAGILVGVGPGAACTTRGVLGIGVPQITATADVAAARSEYWDESSRYVAVITDGGMRVGGDVTKALALGADAVMIGSPLGAAVEAASGGYNWGMATADVSLPRGTRIAIGTTATLEQILIGPAEVDDGTQNLVGAVRSALGVCGAASIQEFHSTEIVIAPELVSEGKAWQRSQRVGMGK